MLDEHMGDSNDDVDITNIVHIYNLVKPNFQNICKLNPNIQSILKNNMLVLKFINYGYTYEDASAITFSFMVYMLKELNGLN